MQTKPPHPWLMLISRSVLFMLFQSLIALVLMSAGASSAWDESARWWMFMTTFANIVSIYLLVRMFKVEGRNFFKDVWFSRATVKKDLLWFFGLSLIGLPIAAVVRDPLAVALFGDSMTATNRLFLPLPTWAFVLSFLFPLTIVFAELPTYFGYVMPRLEAQLKNGWTAWLIASFFLAAQHMFLPFALFTGLALRFRPTLLPYFMILHGLMDVTTVLVYLMI